MRSAQAVCTVCILFGIICDVRLVFAQLKFARRNANPSPGLSTKLEEDIQKVIDQIHSMSNGNQRSLSDFSTGVDLNAYYSILNNLSSLIKPLVAGGYVDNLPQTLVCILSERQDCGLHAELTKSVSAGLGQPLLSLLSSSRSQTCTPPTTSGGTTSSSLWTYLSGWEMLTPLFSSFQQNFLNMLENLSLTEEQADFVNGLMDSFVTYLLKVVASILDGPIDYVNIALQFGIKVPSLDQNDNCAQGDLKQLIMWGLRHNVSWSLSMPFIDVLLEILLPSEQLPYMFPAQSCQSPSTDPSQSSSSNNKSTKFNLGTLCNSSSLAALNETMCADVLSGSGDGSSTSLLAFCQALSSLSSSQIQLAWRNMCYMIQALVSPLAATSSDCFVAPQPPPAATSPNASSSAPVRVAREAPNIQQPACNYSSWLGNGTRNASLVSLCSNYDRVEFVRRVCNNSLLMKKLLSDQTNVWLYGYCANSSADPGYMVSQFCVYQQWMEQLPQPVDPGLLRFCLSLDGPKLNSLICENTGFFMVLFSNPDNWQLMPNCSNVVPPQMFTNPPLTLDSCKYSDWDDVMQITTDILTKCILYDQMGFMSQVCSNQTFLSGLLLNQDIAWVGDHCSASLIVPPMTTPSFNPIGWCDYQTWGDRPVDDSIVAYCRQTDQQNFNLSVCCKLDVLQKLLENPQNQWLISDCTTMEPITVIPQICRYPDWNTPIIVDMTEVALCAEIDPINFNSNVCANNTVLQNLLANQDNIWLIKYCNHSASIPPGQNGFKPSEQCQYSKWTSSLPNATLLVQCWERDQTTFVFSVCPNSVLLMLLAKETSKEWVSTMCKAYSNYTALMNATVSPNNGASTSTNNGTTPSPSSSTTTSALPKISTTTSANKGTTTLPNNSITAPPIKSTSSPPINSTTTPEPDFCLASKVMKQFNWNCPNSFIFDCDPCVTQNMFLQMIVRCWVESMSFKMGNLLALPVTTVLDQTVSVAVVIMLAIEDVKGPSWHVNATIRPSVLQALADYLNKETSQVDKRVLLQCFGTLLGGLLQTTRDLNTDDLLLVKEYFNLPLSSLRPVLALTSNTIVRLMLQYYAAFKNTLQVSNEYLSTMVSALLQTHLATDKNLLLELAPMLPAASPADIQSLPPVQSDVTVRDLINRNLGRMNLAQQEAFGLWYSQGLSATNISGGVQSVIRDTGNLIAYLPFQTFQQLSAAQLLDGLDVLLKNTLTLVKQDFIANKIIGTFKNLTAQDFVKLGNLTCLADPNDLLVYQNSSALQVIQNNILNCTLKGLSMPSLMISKFVLNNPELQVPSSLSSGRLSELAPLLPVLGLPFLQNLTGSQLLAALPALSSTPFSTVQASIIVDKLFSVNSALTPSLLQQLGSLVVGVKSDTLLSLSSDQLLAVLKALAQSKQTQQCGLCPPEANAVATKLWGFSDVVNWLNDVKPLLSCTPLLSVLPRSHPLLQVFSNTSAEPWNTQQAQAIFTNLFNTNPNQIKQDFLSVGTLGQGVSCEVLQSRFQANPTPSSIRKFLAFLRQQPRLLHTSLKKCVIDALIKFTFFSDLLPDLGGEIALTIPLSTVRLFTVDQMDTLRKVIIEEPRYFLMLSRNRQELLVDRISQKLGMRSGMFTEAEFRSLGIMASFVADEVFFQVDRSFFVQNLNLLKGLCYSSNKMEIVSRILIEPGVFGPVKSWNETTLSLLGRFFFFLSTDALQDISLPLMTVGRIEKLFLSQQRWERGDVGVLCSNQNDRMTVFNKEQFVLQLFLGFLKITPSSPTPMVPTCEILRTTAPSAWPSNSLSSMSTSAFSNCLELMGQDPFLASYQRSEVLKKVKKVYGPVSSFSQSLIAQLGGILTELTTDELSLLQLTEQRSIGALGAVSTWSSMQLTALFTTVLNSLKKSPTQLDSSTLVALGYIICGAKTTDIRSFNNIEFSKAVLWLGRLKLSCSEDQMLALVGLLTNSLVFGLMSSWNTDVFIEIGVMAAGLPDMAMSALVEGQIRGISPDAISIIPPDKFAVVFSPNQISMFSYEQAVAVTSLQIAGLSDVQNTALALVLNPDIILGVKSPRGNSLGSPLSQSPLCLTLLMLLTVQFCKDT